MQPFQHRQGDERRVFLAEGSDLLSFALQRFLNSHAAGVTARAATAFVILRKPYSAEELQAAIDLALCEGVPVRRHAPPAFTLVEAAPAS